MYDEDVDIDKLTIQKEELDGVEWFDLEEVYQACQPPRDEKFCVPMSGLEIVRKYVSNQENVAKSMSLGMSMGMLFGMAIGITTHKIGTCMCTGMMLGMVLGLVNGTREEGNR